MTGKMMVLRIGVMTIGLLSAAGCQRSYLAAGPHGDFDLSGIFDVGAQVLANGCSEVRTEQAESRLDVQHRPGDLRLTLVFEGDAYPTSVKHNGKFASEMVQRTRGGAVENVTMRGRFGDSTISASLDVRRGAVRPVLPTTGTHMAAACRYHVNVSGTRIAEHSR